MTNSLQAVAKNRINQACDRFKVLNCAFSTGKDSSCVLLLIFMVLLERKKAGLTVPVLYVTTSSTGIESVPIQENIEYQHKKINEFCALNQLECYTDIARPKMGDDFIGILSGRGFMPSPRVKSHSCTVSLKIEPQANARKAFKKAHGYTSDDIIVLIGSRSDESTNRKKNISKKGHETGEAVLDEKTNEYSMAPIVDWTGDDVWELIGEAISGMIPTWDSLDKTIKIYRAAAGGECPVVAGDTLAKSGGCGSSRTGCSFCTAISAENSSDAKIAQDPEFAFTLPLHNIQRWLGSVIENNDNRQWISRSLLDESGKQIHPANLPSYSGKVFVKVAPQYYSAEVLRNLFRYVLSAQMDENEWAAENDTKPRFTYLTLEECVFIDAKWSERMVAPPFAAMHDLHEIMDLGKRYYPDVDNIRPVAYTKFPKTKYIEVPNFYHEDSYFKGLIDSMEGLAGCHGHTTKAYSDNGKTMKNPNGVAVPEYLNMDTTFTINTDELWYIEDNLAEYSEKHLESKLGMTGGIRHYLRLGIISLSPVMATNLDFRLRMNEHLFGKGYLDMTNEELYAFAQDIEFSTPVKKECLADIPVVLGEAHGSGYGVNSTKTALTNRDERKVA